MRDLKARMEVLVSPEPNTGCWLWTGDAMKAGYGRIRIGGRRGKMVRASRLSWELHNGPIPDGLWVLHRCDTPACVNPDHLFLGTHRDNMRDCIRKGRFVRPTTRRPRPSHCPRGHEYTPENAEETPAGRLISCRTCRNERRRRIRAERKEMSPLSAPSPASPSPPIVSLTQTTERAS